MQAGRSLLPNSLQKEGAEGHGLYQRSLEDDSSEPKVDGLPPHPEIRVIAIAPNAPADNLASMFYSS